MFLFIFRLSHHPSNDTCYSKKLLLQRQVSTNMLLMQMEPGIVKAVQLVYDHTSGKVGSILKICILFLFHFSCWISSNTSLLYIIHGPICAALLVSSCSFLSLCLCPFTSMCCSHWFL